MVDLSQMDCSNVGLFDNNFIGQNYSYATGRRSGRVRSEDYSNAVSEETIQAGLGAATALASVAANKQPNVAKQARKATKKENKSVCGRRPLSKKKRAVWQECVNKYTASKNSVASSSIPDSTPSPAVDYASSRTSNNSDSNNSTQKKFYQKPLFIGTAVIVVVLGGFLIYSKFIKKAPIAIPTT